MPTLSQLKDELNHLQTTPLPSVADLGWETWNKTYEEKQQEISKLRLAITNLEYPDRIIERRILTRIESNRLLDELPDLLALLNIKFPQPPTDFEGRLIAWQKR